jgi:DNA polymerase-3 subunit delta'
MALREVLGHQRLVQLIARSVSRESLPPSLIFCGPAGVGKRLTAIATAQLLNCPNRVGEGAHTDACGKCAVCGRIARGLHSDVLLVEPEESGSIKIEQIRDVVERSAYRPFEGRRRVVIVDGAEALVPQAQNALLKTLEEPPAASVFILVTPQPDLLLPTVRSRCPSLRFGPLNPQDVAAVLEQRGRTSAEAHAVAATADGSLRRALESLAGDLVLGRDTAEQALVRAAASDDPRRRIDGAKDLVPKTSSAAGDRERLAIYLRSMSSILRDAALVSLDADAGGLANADRREMLERLARTYRGDRAVAAFTAVDRALAALDRNAGVKIVADWVMLQL